MSVTDMGSAMRSAQLSASDRGGGAEQVAWRLHQALLQRGVEDVLYVGQSAGRGEVRQLSNGARYHSLLGLAARVVERISGVPFLYYPASRGLIDALTQHEVVHLHNLHGDFFELRRLPELCARMPVLLTLHDLFWLTGHCASPMDCPRFERGCGRCPDLRRHPMVHRDRTAWLRSYKREIMQRARPRVLCPTRWIADQWCAAGLPESCVQVLPLGLDLKVFRPAVRRQVRAELGMAAEDRVVMFAAFGGLDNPYKDGAAVIRAIERLATANIPGLRLLLVGGGRRPERLDALGIPLTLTGPIDDDARMARLYSAADVLLHATRADNSPLVLMEAMACGCPLVAADVGGVPELCIDGVNGRLVPLSDDAAMAEACRQILQDPDLARRLGEGGQRQAQRRHSMHGYVDAVLAAYRQAVRDFQAR